MTLSLLLNAWTVAAALSIVLFVGPYRYRHNVLGKLLGAVALAGILFLWVGVVLGRAL